MKQDRAPRYRLHRQALAHLAALSPAEAGVWLDRHGPLASTEELPLRQPLYDLLRRRRQRTLAANLHRAGRFAELAGVLAGAGIPVCPLKGIHLLGTVYAEDPEHRPMADVDVLVRAGDAEEAIRLLGPALGLEETALSRRLAARSHERVLVGAGLVVEIHTRLGLRTGRGCGWEELAPAPGRLAGAPGDALAGRGVHLLADDTVLAYLLAHLVQHVPWTRLVWIEDVLRWAERGYDPERTAAEARRLGVRRLAVAAVRALRWGLGEDVLPGLPGRDTGLGVGLVALYEKLAGARWDGPPVARAEGSRFERHLATLLLADRPWDAVRFLWQRSVEAVTKTSPAVTSE